jgi:dTDP-4-amino-4,6-dideoxygalactose transaminase
VAIKMLGASIRYADIDPSTGNIDPSSIEQNINPSTKAIMVVDYAGIPVNVAAIQAISKKHQLPVIHDAAHSLGSRYAGNKSGNHFPYTIFSLQAIKHLTTVDGGILQLSSKEDYEKGKLIRWFGLDKYKTRLDNNIQLQGFKYHMNNVNASIGILQLKHINHIVDQYIANGKYFDESLKGIPGIELLHYYPDSEPSYWLYTLKVENREGFIEMLNKNGIAASELHKRNDFHDYLNDFHDPLPKLDEFYAKMVHIPCGWWLSKEDREKIVQLIKAGWE